MKYTFTCLLLALNFVVFSQTIPLKINYQGVARSSSGKVFTNQPIGIQFRILQGSPGGTVAAQETQVLTTNLVGIFSTQISNNLGTINWASGPYYLEVAIDTTGGSSYITLGTQQLVSVPYALYAASAPAPTVSYSNNVLAVGPNTVVINTPTTATQGTSITATGAISSTLSGNSYSLDVPVVNVSAATLANNTAAGLAQVVGTYPNFSVMVAPVISYSPSIGTLSLSSAPFTNPSYQYTYDITPQLALSGNVLSVGPGSNSVTLPGSGPAVPNTSLVSSGIAVTSTLGTNSYSINVPTPTLTPQGGISINGSYPSYTISSLSTAPTSITASGTGSAVVSSVGTNTFNISVPAVSLTTSGGGITQGGTYPNLTLNSPSVSVVANPTAGLAQVQGTYPNYTVTVAPNFSYSSATGSLVVSNPAAPFTSYSTNITPSVSFNSGVLTVGPASNSVSLPAAATASVAGSGAASVSFVGSSYTVNVPQTTVTTSGTGGAVVTNPGVNNFDISVPAFSLTAGSGISTSGTYPNITVSALSQAQTSITASGTGGAVVSSVGTNTFDISVPAFSLTAGTGISTSGTYPNITVSALPQSQTSITASGTGGAVVSSSGTNTFDISVPAVSLTATGGGATMGGSYPNLSINVPSVSITPSINLFGTPVASILQKAGSYPNYSLFVSPDISYSNITGSLTLQSLPFTSPTYSVSYNITPSLSHTNNIIQSGPVSNTVAIITPAAQAFALNSLALTVFPGGTQLCGPFAFTKQSATSEIDVFVHSEVFSGTFLVLATNNIEFEIRVDGAAAAISIPEYIDNSATYRYVTLKSVFAGLAAGPHTVSVWAKVDGGTSLLVQVDPNNRGGKVIVKETY